MAEPPPLIRDPAVHLWAGRCENWRHAAVSMLKPPEGEPAGETRFRPQAVQGRFLPIPGAADRSRREHQETCGPHARPGTGDNSGFATAARIKLARRTVCPEALSGILANLLVLLDHSTFRRFNEPDQHVHVLTAIRLRLQLFQGLCGVALGGKKNLIGLLNLSNSLL